MTTKPDAATWVRVRLTAPQDERGPRGVALTEGELVLRADRVAVDGEHLVFLCSDEVVFRLDRRYFRALTWFVDRPTFGEWLKARRAQFPNSHTRWSDEECDLLRGEVASSAAWKVVAEKHGRTVAAVKRQAALLGFAAD